MRISPSWCAIIAMAGSAPFWILSYAEGERRHQRQNAQARCWLPQVPIMGRLYDAAGLERGANGRACSSQEAPTPHLVGLALCEQRSDCRTSPAFLDEQELVLQDYFLPARHDNNLCSMRVKEFWTVSGNLAQFTLCRRERGGEVRFWGFLFGVVLPAAEDMANIQLTFGNQAPRPASQVLQNWGFPDLESLEVRIAPLVQPLVALMKRNLWRTLALPYRSSRAGRNIGFPDAMLALKWGHTWPRDQEHHDGEQEHPPAQQNPDAPSLLYSMAD